MGVRKRPARGRMAVRLAFDGRRGRIGQLSTRLKGRTRPGDSRLVAARVSWLPAARGALEKQAGVRLSEEQRPFEGADGAVRGDDLSFGQQLAGAVEHQQAVAEQAQSAWRVRAAEQPSRVGCPSRSRLVRCRLLPGGRQEVDGAPRLVTSPEPINVLEPLTDLERRIRTAKDARRPRRR